MQCLIDLKKTQQKNKNKHIQKSDSDWIRVNIICWSLINGYCYRKWAQLKSWMRLFTFHMMLIPLGKVCIQLFSPPAINK